MTVVDYAQLQAMSFIDKTDGVSAGKNGCKPKLALRFTHAVEKYEVNCYSHILVLSRMDFKNEHFFFDNIWWFNYSKLPYAFKGHAS